MDTEKKPDQKPPTLLQTIGSVAAAFFGVQSSENRRRDFSRGNPWVFIAVGLVMTLAFIIGLWAVVKLVLSNAGL